MKADVNKRVIKFYDVHHPNIDILNEMLSNYNRNHLKIYFNINSVYRAFLVVIEWHSELCVTHKEVTLSFITPLIKSLLRKQDILMNRGKLDKVDEITIKIAYLIAEKHRNFLAIVDATSTKRLWDSVKTTSCHHNTSASLMQPVPNGCGIP